MKRRTEKDEVFEQLNYESTALSFLNFEFWVSGGKDEQRRKGRMIFREGSIQIIIYKRSFYPVDHLQYTDDHFQEAGPSGWSFAKGWSIMMIICKRPVHLDDHKAGPSR